MRPFRPPARCLLGSSDCRDWDRSRRFRNVRNECLRARKKASKRASRFCRPTRIAATRLHLVTHIERRSSDRSADSRGDVWRRRKPRSRRGRTQKVACEPVVTEIEWNEPLAPAGCQFARRQIEIGLYGVNSRFVVFSMRSLSTHTISTTTFGLMRSHTRSSSRYSLVGSRTPSPRHWRCGRRAACRAGYRESLVLLGVITPDERVADERDGRLCVASGSISRNPMLLWRTCTVRAPL